jgi:hypothetical protein
MESRASDRTVPRQGSDPQQAEPRQVDPPTPTQAEADAIKQQAHGEGEGDSGEAATAPPAVVDVPHVAGNGAVGDTLSCTMGNWTGEPTSYGYQWKSDGTADLGTGGTYVVAASDSGHSITCVVTATNALGSTVAPPSNAVLVA